MATTSHYKSLSFERLSEIERFAQESRALGITRQGELYYEEQSDGASIWLDVEELGFVASLLIGGEVTSVPNFCVQGERLAGGIKWLSLDMATISYEAFDPAVRQRFSIAHEVGHYFLHKTTILAQGGKHNDPAKPEPEDDEGEEVGIESIEHLTENDPVLETEADAFAAAFLMPTSFVAHDIHYFGSAIPFLAARYGVSRVALQKRLLTLAHLQLLCDDETQSSLSVAEDVLIEKECV